MTDRCRESAYPRPAVPGIRKRFPRGYLRGGHEAVVTISCMTRGVRWGRTRPQLMS